MTGTVGAILGWTRQTLEFFHRVLWPVLLLGVRLWLFRIFTEHAMDAAMRGPADALGGSPLALLQVTAAGLLALGLMTRVAAIPIAYLSFVVYFGEYGVSGHVLCGLLAAGLIVHGPGAISLDSLIGRGLTRSPLPWADWPRRLYQAMADWAGPVFLLAIRLWMGGLFWMTGERLINPSGAPLVDYGSAITESALAPLMTSPTLMVVQLIAGVLLVIGLGTRIAALVLSVLTLAVLAGDAAMAVHPLWALVLGYLVFAGPGPISLDRGVDRWLARRFPEYVGRPAFSLEDCPRVVVVGAGFGGLAAVRALAKAKARITVVDRRNYHLFQPLLYQVATAFLSPADIAMPIRGILRDQVNARVIFGRVTGVDKVAREVLVGEDRLPYDYLVLATGARHAYFGRDDWEELAPGLKKIDDATHVRQNILLAFERAETAQDPAERDRLMTFIIVGAGPTGVELAGAIAELARHGMAGDFRAIDPAQAHVILVQSAPRILPMFPEKLSREAHKSLEEMGVEVRVDSRVTEIDDDGVDLKGGERIRAGTVLWAAGVRASRAAKWLGCEADRAGRVIVEPDLSVPGHPDIFVIGDTASVTAPDGSPVPGLAPAAKQAGAHVARVIKARLAGRPHPGPFRYRHLGSLATIGRDSAIADFGWLKLSGYPAWWLWGAVHVLFLLGTRNRLSVILNWLWSYITYRSSTRLITGPVDETRQAETAAPPAPASRSAAPAE